MTVFYARGGPTDQLSHHDLEVGLTAALDQLGSRKKVLAVPPDATRRHSRAGELTCMTHRYFGDRLVDVMPALGTHHRMTMPQLKAMFPGLPLELIRVHDWKRDVITIGTVSAEFVKQATEGIYDRPWPAQLNQLVWKGGHDLIISLGQVVPHEVIGMANYNKNLFVGTGGKAGINESHFIGAVYGMERMMGRADTPLRRILNFAEREFCSHLPIVYVLTVVGTDAEGELVTRGLFIGDDTECFERACTLSVTVNFETFEQPLDRIVCYLDPHEFSSTWLGNKSIYRTRMAIADGGELIVVAPGVKEFGEQPEFDRLIRQFGYRSTPEILAAVDAHPPLRDELAAAAHLIHGSTEGRFRVIYCPGKLSRNEIESVGYEFGDLKLMQQKYVEGRTTNGWYETDEGRSYYFIRNPALGLWAARERLAAN